MGDDSVPNSSDTHVSDKLRNSVSVSTKQQERIATFVEDAPPLNHRLSNARRDQESVIYSNGDKTNREDDTLRYQYLPHLDESTQREPQNQDRDS